MKKRIAVQTYIMLTQVPEFRLTRHAWPDGRPYCNQEHADVSRCPGL
jgi:hypothetical protein